MISIAHMKLEMSKYQIGENPKNMIRTITGST
jgi:hypothetical protein